MAKINGLSNREWEVIKLLLQGKSNKLIAASLGISVRTVEFHLKNIYTKLQVSSRIELILELGNPTGKSELDKPVYSTVDIQRENVENRERQNSRMFWTSSFNDAISVNSKEFNMKQLWNTKYVSVGVLTAVFAGLVWVSLLRTYGHMALSDIRTWLVPLILIMAIIGLATGLMGKWNSNSLLKVFFSTLVGAALSPIAILPIMGVVVLPLGKLAEGIGLINRAKISSHAATILAISSMMTIWLFLGITFGVMLLFITIKKPGQRIS